MRDRTRIAYERFGRTDGPYALLLDGISCDGFIWPYLRPFLAERYQVIHPHYRGHGRSGIPRAMETMTVGYVVEDIAELLDQLGVEDAIVLSHSMGVQVTVELAARHPSRVRAGILLCGSSGRLLDTFKETDLGAKLLPFIEPLTEHFRGTIGRVMRAIVPTGFATLVAGFGEPNRRLIEPAHLRNYMDHVSTMLPDVIVTLLSDASQRSGTHLLPRIEQPMLVIAGSQDGFTPPRVSEAMVEALPRAVYSVLDEGSHTAPVELPKETQAAVEAFLDDLGGADADTLAPRASLAEVFRRRASHG